MSKIDTKIAYEFTKDLTVLYAEDDLIVRKQTQKILKLLFNSVEIANDGEEAFAKFKEQHFDIVITDIVMPNMDGLELSKKIREIDQEQNIIITSAYNDADQLIEFINLHIRQFMLKPIEINNMLLTLYNVSKSIINSKMVEDYRLTVENQNQKLKDKNEELEKIVSILDTKLSQLNIDKKQINTNLQNIQEEHLKEFKELEHDINGTITLVNLSKNINQENINVLSDLFSQYANILSKYSDYENLSTKINALVNVLNTQANNFILHIKDTSILLESFIYVLKMWRNNLEQSNTEKAFKLHASMINDIITIIAIIQGNADDIESEMEFF